MLKRVIEVFLLVVLVSCDNVDNSDTNSGDRITPQMIEIAGGTFIWGDEMGTGMRHSVPTSSVTISPFFIGKYEVTQAEYQSIMGENPSKYQDLSYPVDNISYFDIMRYCNELSKLMGKEQVYTIHDSLIGEKFVELDYSKKGFRLPTEAEWEYACKAGSSTNYYFGNDSTLLSEYAWYSDTTSHPVGVKKPNAFGLYDMHGNVYEMCENYSLYSAESKVDPTEAPKKSIYKSLRGGSWDHNARYSMSAFRSEFDSFLRSDNVGFRVVLPQ